MLPKMWTVNDFKPTMSTKVFKNLRDHLQIFEHIPIHLRGKFEKCYSGKIANVGMYDAMFAARLKLPLTTLHRQLAIFLGFSIIQITPNTWRIFLGAEILWGLLSGGNRQLTLNEFFYRYRPQHIISSQGYITSRSGIRSLSWCQTCPTPIGIGRANISLIKGRIGCAVHNSGWRCLMVLTTLGALSRIQV